MNLIIFTDGGARGNPGPAAVGVVIKSEEKIITQFGKKIGETTNNVAEYTAVVEALRWIRDNKILRNEDIKGGKTKNPSISQFPNFLISFYLDSKLVVNQLKGLFKIKDAKMQELAFQVHKLENEINLEIRWNLIPREQNKLADAMVNQALDS